MIGDPNNSSTFYSGGTVLSGSVNVMAVSKTTDGGTSWARSLLTTTAGFTYALTIDRTDSRIVYAGGNPGVYKSTDAGTSWFSSSTGLSGTVYALAVHATTTSTLFAGSSAGVYKSTDGGASWSSTGCSSVIPVAVDPLRPNDVYAGTRTGVYKSTIGGGNWTAMNDGLLDLNVTSLAVNPGSYLFASTGGAGLYRWLFTDVAENTASARSRGFAINPNPTAGRSTISYALPRSGKVRLVLYDNQGRLVRTLVTAVQDAGNHSITYQTDELAAGVYFVELVTPEAKTQQKLVVVR